MELFKGIRAQEDPPAELDDCPVCGGKTRPVEPLKEGNGIKPHKCVEDGNHIIYQ